MRIKASQMALAGMMTAMAVVVMSLGSLIPVNTYICPVLCILINRLVTERCGRRLGWCYYMASALLSLLLAPDREAAMVYVCLGYYPLIRHVFERIPTKVLRLAAKIGFFTAAGVLSLALTMAVMGLDAVLAEYRETGVWLALVTILLWDVLFLLVDRLLEPRPGKRKR